VFQYWMIAAAEDGFTEDLVSHSAGKSGGICVQDAENARPNAEEQVLWRDGHRQVYHFLLFARVVEGTFFLDLA
jgi:hypothetical protein